MVEDVAETGQASRWYAIQTYSGHENKVKTLLERKIAELPGEAEEKLIREVIVPTREVVEIKGGKKARMLKSPVYNGVTPEFWASCDQVCGPGDWRIWGLLNCGKGEPNQLVRDLQFLLVA